MERYVSFVKEWASDHGLTYMCSIGDPRLKADYAEFKKTGKKPKKSGRASKYQNKEEARRANIAKTNERKRAKKMIQAGTPERVVETEPKKQGYELYRIQYKGAKGQPMESSYFVENERKGLGFNDRKVYDSGLDRTRKKYSFYHHEDVEHGGLLGTLGQIETLADLVKSGNKTMTQGEGIFDRGNQMPPSSRDYLQKNGDQTITSMRIERIPLGKLQKSLTAIVYVRELLTKFKKPENIPQDDLFHLQLVLTLSNGRRVMWAKEEVVRLSETIYKGDKMEFKDLGKTNIKLQDFVDKTAKYMGAKFAPYNAFDNNCQDFIMASLKSNGLGTKADYDFVKQDTKDLFKGRQWLINMMKGATDLAAAFNVLIEGKGLEDLIPKPPATGANPFLSIPPDLPSSKVLTDVHLRRLIDEYLEPPIPPMEDLKRGPTNRKRFGGV